MSDLEKELNTYVVERVLDYSKPKKGDDIWGIGQVALEFAKSYEVKYDTDF